MLTRRRQAGGSAHDWNTPMNDEMGAKYVPLDAIDFTERVWLPMSGWPFGLSSLIPFYERAHDVCALGPYTYHAEDYADTLSTSIVFRSEVLRTGVYRFGVRQLFTDLYPTEVTRAADIALYLHATVVSLETDRAGERVTHARVRCRPKTEFQVRASIFVLAAGGIENARLLLLSSRTNGGGLDDREDTVGRCFMEHPRLTCALANAAPAVLERLVFYRPHDTAHGMAMGRLTLTDEVMRRERLLNMSITFLPSVGRWSVLRRRRSLMILINLEQAPDLDNRVTLGSERDALGQPKVALWWRWRDVDRRNLERLRTVLAREFEHFGLGRLEAPPDALPDPNAHHHLGTTRMHGDPRYGVVDQNGRVHGTANLFVAGSSVFPTGGYANPTLTIVALSLRMADHIRSMLAHARPRSSVAHN
jgi:choline dehydrogenase-like flavoprotein